MSGCTTTVSIRDSETWSRGHPGEGVGIDCSVEDLELDVQLMLIALRQPTIDKTLIISNTKHKP